MGNRTNDQREWRVGYVLITPIFRRLCFLRTPRTRTSNCGSAYSVFSRTPDQVDTVDLHRLTSDLAAVPMPLTFTKACSNIILNLGTLESFQYSITLGHFRTSYFEFHHVLKRSSFFNWRISYRPPMGQLPRLRRSGQVQDLSRSRCPSRSTLSCKIRSCRSRQRG